MNAFLLAAGLGTRLRPLTCEIPKCMVEICGKPLLGWWLEKLEALSIEKVLINTHHLAPQVERFVAENNFNINIELFHEDELLGSAGTIKANRGFIDDKDFLIIYGDNLTNIDLKPMIDHHVEKSPVMTMGLMEMPRPETRGIAVLNDDNVITDFVEKSANPPGNLANAGLKVASPELFNYLDGDKKPLDLGFDILPRLIGKMHGFVLEGYLQDIGNPEDLESARKNWKSLVSKTLT
ncbi:MAG: NTP transferase domain-containing protein [candidate division Zixibacteria bacterium]|nr:NTP transferase domain-containing protein [candidate division Zixibacteria bacterium]